ncbi:MAG: ferredoxin, partial [Oscillospiraceae bacterium]|nr:ferredoxin [Oscillospiraceae bacterium]
CKIVFIGPCTAKKAEAQKDSVKAYIDNVITFEELQALFDSRDIKLGELENEPLDNASYFGRIFARSGGLADAVAEALKEMEIPEDVFKLKAITCDGIENCKTALFKAQKGVGGENFIEGMACIDGCIGGPACLTHGPKDKMAVDKYGKEAAEKSILDAINILNL